MGGDMIGSNSRQYKPNSSSAISSPVVVAVVLCSGTEVVEVARAHSQRIDPTTSPATTACVV
eukprot:12191776-Heterocapsa_arctica.AAC.1